MERNELEEFFVECVEEVRKDIVRRRNQSAAYSIKKNVNSKKHTTSKTIENKNDNDDSDTRLDQYTATDKKKVIELLMSNENVLLFLYEKLFPAV